MGEENKEENQKESQEKKQKQSQKECQDESPKGAAEKAQEEQAEPQAEAKEDQVESQAEPEEESKEETEEVPQAESKEEVEEVPQAESKEETEEALQAESKKEEEEASQAESKKEEEEASQAESKKEEEEASQAEAQEMKVKPQKSMKKTVGIIILTVLASLLLIYLFVSLYFMRHFYGGTTIDDVKVGGRSVTKVEKILKDQMADYVLTLKERDNESEEIKGSEIGLNLEVKDKLEAIKHKQNGFVWLFKIGSDQVYTLDNQYTYDETKLKTAMNALSCLDDKHNKKPEDASVVYEKDSYVIKAGDKGNLIDKDAFWKSLTAVITKGQREMDLEEEKCYEEAKYQVDSKEIIDLKDGLNNYLKSEVTYEIGNSTEKLTASQIKDWLKIDKDLKASLDRSQVEAYVEKLAEKYDTVGRTRNFKTTSGNEIQISGGDYGWAIDEDKETHELVKALQGYKSVTRSPIYSQEAVTAYDAVNDIGSTYVEINLTQQHLWLYNGGKLITEGSIVSGTADGRHATPPGVYKIDYMERNATLRGPGYACPVSFWMPFNQDIGMHDAVWRGSFGGNIYMTNGSHGCINCPYSLVETIFNNVKTGTAVVCYH